MLNNISLMINHASGRYESVIYSDFVFHLSDLPINHLEEFLLTFTYN